MCVIASVLTSSALSQVYAEQATTLATIKVMADAELRDEVLTTVQPFQEDRVVREALQHQMIKQEQNIQNHVIADHATAVNLQAQPMLPDSDMSNLNPMQQEYVLAVAAGLQSNDPTAGLFKMLEPLGVDRDRALNNVRNGGGALPFNLDQQRLDQLLGDKWRTN